MAYVYRLLGPDATVASGKLELGVGSPVYVLASSPGSWAERLVVRVIRRSVEPAWAIEVQPAGGPAERGTGRVSAVPRTAWT